MGVVAKMYQPVHLYTINPKAITMGVLYGKVDTMTNEWKDGLIGSIVRHACAVSSKAKCKFLI